jgi:four helix bundle protein
MTNWTTLPHENLTAYQVACELLVAVKRAEIADPKLRDQALRAAKSVCLNIAEATGRTGPDQKRVFCIARGASESVAALHIAGLCGDCDVGSARVGAALGRRVYALLSGLIRC